MTIAGAEIVASSVAKHGPTSKSVRAICAAHGWRWTRNGAPDEWYAAWRSWIGGEFERALAGSR